MNKSATMIALFLICLLPMTANAKEKFHPLVDEMKQMRSIYRDLNNTTDAKEQLIYADKLTQAINKAKQIGIDPEKSSEKQQQQFKKGMDALLNKTAQLKEAITKGDVAQVHSLLVQIKQQRNEGHKYFDVEE